MDRRDFVRLGLATGAAEGKDHDAILDAGVRAR